MNATIYFFLTFLGGPFGIHKFATKKYGMGLLYLFTGGLFCIGWIIDIIKAIKLLLEDAKNSNSATTVSRDNNTENNHKYSLDKYVTRTQNIKQNQLSDSVDNKITKKYFTVSGVSHKQEAFKELAFENDDYNLSKKDLSEIYMDSDRIYKYSFSPTSVNLIPEPTNEYDKNAIMVQVDDLHIGYIKKEECLEVKSLLDSGKNLKIEAYLFGGPYKTLYSDWDYDKDKEVYTIEKDSTYFSARIIISYYK